MAQKETVSSPVRRHHPAVRLALYDLDRARDPPQHRWQHQPPRVETEERKVQPDLVAKVLTDLIERLVERRRITRSRLI